MRSVGDLGIAIIIFITASLVVIWRRVKHVSIVVVIQVVVLEVCGIRVVALVKSANYVFRTGIHIERVVEIIKPQKKGTA